MSSRCDFLLNFFGERHILLKDDWLTTVIEYLNNNLPASRTCTNEKFADLVFDQWASSNFESTSFPVFGNHAIDEKETKLHLLGPIVCQVNSFIDTGSPYYAQFTSLNDKTTVDRSGFDKVFHEKDDDYDKKPSRLLKLTLTDGETSLKAIEFWKCPQLSLYCKPGVKILIQPPCLIRRGTFLLKPNNCKILGGGVLPLLNCRRPLEQYARMLGIKIKSRDPMDEEEKASTVPSAAPRPPAASFSSNLNSSTSNSTPSTVPVRVPAGPTPLLAKYLAKPPACIPSTSKPREISPDIMAGDDDDDDWENSNFDDNEPLLTPIRPRDVTVASLLSKNNAEEEDFETRKTPRLAKEPAMKTPPSENNHTFRIPGMLTSRRVDPKDELLENMIEEGEEPAKSPEKPQKNNLNPFKKKLTPKKSPSKSPRSKKIKVEHDSDDDIQIIELVTPPSKKVEKDEKRKDRKKEEKENVEEESEEKATSSPEEKAALEAFAQLKLSSFAEIIKRMKYSIGSRRFNLLAIIEDIAEPLRVVDNMWTMKVEMADESGKAEAYVDNNTLINLIGYTCEEAMAIRNSSDIEKRKDGKRRLDGLEQQLQRLDLVFEIEFFAGSTPSSPVIRSMKTLAEKIDVY